jgi:hypothetical protein
MVAARMIINVELQYPNRETSVISSDVVERLLWETANEAPYGWHMLRPQDETAL